MRWWLGILSAANLFGVIPATYPEVRIASVGVFNQSGQILLGLRHDTRLWTAPGGHLENGEMPARGALRELHEEAGLVPTSLDYLGDGVVRGGDGKLLRIYCFKAIVPDNSFPHSVNDPDMECAEWHWVDTSLGSLPPQYSIYLSHPNNILLRYLGLQRGTISTSEDQLPDMDTSDYAKIMVEIPHQAPKPIEGNQEWVFLQICRQFPTLAGKVAYGDVPSLARLVNETNQMGVFCAQGLPFPFDYLPSPPDFVGGAWREISPAQQAWFWNQHCLKDPKMAIGAKGHLQNFFYLTDHLDKAMPGFKFPALGISDDRRETPIVTTPREEKVKNLAIYNAGKNAGVKVPDKAKFLQGGKTLGGSSNFGPTTTSYALANSLYPRGYQKTDKSDLATKLHEDFHNIFKRVQNKYGKDGRKALASNLMSKLKFQDPQAHGALTRFFKQANSTARAGKPVPLEDEEHFSTLLNYLNDKSYRNRVHKHFFGSTDLTGKNNRSARNFNNAMKRAYKTSMQNAMVANKLDVMYKSENLEKGLPGLVAALALAGPMNMHQEQKWDPAGLPEEMHPIAQLESSGGKLMHHVPSPKGPFYTAHGALGYKPSTAYDEYRTSPRLQSKFPTKTPEEFYQHFTTRPEMYKELAHQHWRKLMRISNNNPQEAAFRWHFGVNKLATPETITNDEYAKRYKQLLGIGHGATTK